MLFKQVSRFMHTGKLYFAAEKSNLAALRKKTGYTFANCKKALELHNNDLTNAENWLRQEAQKLGWSKATKLEGRSTKQGLIGVLIDRNIGAMVEVNCETDFVARNNNFQEFVANVSKACVNYAQQFPNNSHRIALSQDELKSITFADGKLVVDHLALLIGNVGENASLRRALCFKTSSTLLLSGYTHPTQTNEIPPPGTPLLGKYGAIMAIKSLNSGQILPLEIQRNLCQHIVGMKPSKIGQDGVDEPNESKDEEMCLIHQEYLLEPSLTIKDILEENSAEIVDFQRFECGESTDELSQVTKAAIN